MSEKRPELWHFHKLCWWPFCMRHNEILLFLSLSFSFTLSQIISHWNFDWIWAMLGCGCGRIERYSILWIEAAFLGRQTIIIADSCYKSVCDVVHWTLHTILCVAINGPHTLMPLSNNFRAVVCTENRRKNPSSFYLGVVIAMVTIVTQWQKL